MSEATRVTGGGTSRTVMIMAGGTGGHVYPALAVAAWLRERRHEVVWLGTAAGIEARVVPAFGLPIEWVHVSGLRGKSLRTWLLAPVRISRALVESVLAIRRRRPDVVLGMGGFVTGPGGLAARLLRVPLLIHEQNAIAGLSNRLLSRIANQVLEAFPGSFPRDGRAVFIGNPVRTEIEQIAPPEQRFADRADPPRLLVLGGSQGARALNLTVPASIAALPAELRPRVVHQAGQRGLDDAREAYRKHQVDADVVAFIEDMAAAYAQADLVICRAGALTVAELTTAGIGAILVPYPHAVDDHQTHNGRALVDAGGALMIQESMLDASRLGELLGDLLGDRERLMEMARRSRALARPGAAAVLGDACLQAAAAADRGGAR
jgi:UDP-N-acetylglucosamine--N-acetylmuramyl-(pentapeptide) pyrophosphoryl-undecaprenol N-acetylglucosamine transferase